MKLAPLLFFVLTLSAFAADLKLQQIPAAEVPAATRLDFIERYLGLNRYDWKLEVPKGYRAVIRFLHQGGQKPISELTVSSGQTSHLYFITAPDRDSKGNIGLTFGNETGSVTTFLPRPGSFTTKFGNPGATVDGNLLDIFWDGEKTPRYWVEIQFLKD